MPNKYFLFCFLCLISIFANAHDIEDEIIDITPENIHQYGVNIYIGGPISRTDVKVKVISEFNSHTFEGFLLAAGDDSSWDSLFSTSVNGCKTNSGVEIITLDYDPERISKIGINLIFSKTINSKAKEWHRLFIKLNDFIKEYDSLSDSEQEEAWWNGLAVYSDEKAFSKFDRSFDCR